jgi:hypothetical protein
MNPQEFAQSRINQGYPTPNVPVPQGVMQTAGAALNAAAPGFAVTTPAIQLPLYGTGILVNWATGDEATADTVEGVLGAGMLVRDVARTGTAISRYVARSKGNVPMIEREFLNATEETRVAKESAAKWHAAGEADSAAALTAEARMQAASASHEQAVRDIIEHPPDTMPQGDVRYATDVEQGQTAEVAGQAIRAVGANAEILAQQTGMESANVLMRKIVTERDDAYRDMKALGDKYKITLPLKDGPGLVVMRSGRALYQKLSELGASGAERKVALQLANLGGEVEEGPNGEFIVKAGRPDAGNGAPYRKMLDLYAALRNVSLNPREYPISGNAAKKQVSGILDELDQGLRMLEESKPDLSEKGRLARTIVLDVEKPFQHETMPKLGGKGLTARSVAKNVLMPSTLTDPTHVKRILMFSSPVGRDAYLRSMWRGLIESASDKRGAVDIKTLAKNWDALDEEVQNVMSSGSMPEASGRLSDMFARHEQLTGLATKSQEVADEALKKLKVQSKEFDVARDRMNGAMKMAVKAERRVKGGLEKIDRVMHKREEPRQFRQRIGIMHMLFAGSAGMHDNMVSAALHSAMAFLWLRRPLTLAESLVTPMESLRGRRLAAAIGASIRGLQAQGIFPAGPPTDQSAGQAPKQ